MNIQWRVPMAALTACMILGIVSLCFAQSTPGIIPQPVKMAIQDGYFRITSDTCVAASGDARTEALMLIDFLAPAMGFRLALLDQPTRDNNLIQLLIVSPPDNTLGDEGYELFAATCLLCYGMVGLGFDDRATLLYMWANDMAESSKQWAKQDMEAEGHEGDLTKFVDIANGLWGH